MRNKKLFDETVAILVKAYMNETLEHGEPCACAVGNLIAARGIEPSWGWYNYVRRYSKTSLGTKEVNCTGYSAEEVRYIERAFEGRDIYTQDLRDFSDDPDGYKGLMAVVDVLIEIHEGTEEEAKQAKELFIK